MKGFQSVKTLPFATRLSPEVKSALDRVCRKLGLRKNFVVESALREKIEDLLDAEDLQQAIREAATFQPWDKVKKEVARRGRR
jgi:predicted transcriptional regulator